MAVAALALTTPFMPVPGLAPSAAAQSELDDGSKARINLSGKLRLLSQSIGAAGCRVEAGIDVDASKLVLRDALAQVPAILNGLERGNTALGIPTEERRSRTLIALDGVNKEWRQLQSGIEGLIQDRNPEEAAAKIQEHSPKMLEAAVVLVSEIAAQYSNPNELLFVDAMAIDLAGRQRTLAQQVSMNACRLVNSGGASEVQADLEESMNLFERTLTAFRDGMPALGIRQPPNEMVENKIQSTFDHWDNEQSTLSQLMSAPDPSLVATIASSADELTSDMNDLVILYILSTPGRDNAIRGVLREIGEQELMKWVADPELVAAVKAQNEAHAGLGEDEIIALDNQWRKEADAEGGELIDQILTRTLSATLRQKQVETAGFINEVFVMDNKGLNVGQSAVTSDYWQGDEAKWQEVYGNGSGDIHVSEVEFDESTGVFQSQVSIPVRDLDNGTLIGAVTFGVNVQSLL